MSDKPSNPRPEMPLDPPTEDSSIPVATTETDALHGDESGVEEAKRIIAEETKKLKHPPHGGLWG